MEEWDRVAQVLSMVAATGGVTLSPEELNPYRKAAAQGRQRRLVKPSTVNWG